jgi:hypothetical protein
VIVPDTNEVTVRVVPVIDPKNVAAIMFSLPLFRLIQYDLNRSL